ncbi:helix-turn-helix transcriptional regulator [Pseudonocardia spinosispora]|uniref:helix-turn-helix transcriptional regulator n=1 Tax=Pseudonocardia spinosispora TaxID=103441 RepID=UPI0003F8423D|nr:helix-turn-helix transcriptional regulator [Pseudonocardia spinosispora]
MGECEPRNYLQPCLLLLLRERSDHGYDLASRLRELNVAEGDPGAVYRALRGLERHGLVRSTWHTSDAGPARRTYQLTTEGIADLDRQAELLEATHQTLHVFRSRYQRLRGVNGHDHERIEGGLIPRSRGHSHDHGAGRERGVRPPLRSGERAGG